jgi:hypothetical protein
MLWLGPWNALGIGSVASETDGGNFGDVRMMIVWEGSVWRVKGKKGKVGVKAGFREGRWVR